MELIRHCPQTSKRKILPHAISFLHAPRVDWFAPVIEKRLSTNVNATTANNLTQR